MSYQILGADDVLHLSRLIHELCELGTDTHTWREHLLVELEGMLGVQMSVSYVMRFSLDPQDIAPRTLVYVERGTNEAWKSYLPAGDLSRDPVTVPIMSRFGTDFTVLRSELVDDATWYASDYCRDVARPAGMGDALYSQVAVADPRVVDGLSFCRGFEQPRFTPWDLEIVRLLHQELARLWNRADPVGLHMMPQQQRKVLDGIRRGEGRKVIADKMKISEHTVHTYERALFVRAGVKSRGALLAVMSNLIRPNLLP